MTAKASGIVSGLDIAVRVFKHLDNTAVWISLVKEGERVSKGDKIARIEGSYRATAHSRTYCT